MTYHTVSSERLQVTRHVALVYPLEIARVR
jgi:hypothetical protein